MLPHLLDDYTSDDIYNTDKSGLFYHMLPDKLLLMKGEWWETIERETGYSTLRQHVGHR